MPRDTLKSSAEPEKKRIGEKMYLKDIKDYTDMVRHREEIMFTAEKSRTPELEQEFSTLNEKIASYRKKLFPEREAATICQEAEDGHRYHTDY